MPRKTGPDSSLSSHARRKGCVRGQTGPSDGGHTKADREDMAGEPLSTDKSETRRRTPLRCWRCRQPGHVRGECPALQQQTPLNSMGPVSCFSDNQDSE